MKSKLCLIIAIVFAALAVSAVHTPDASAAASKAKKTKTCQQKATLVNYRSDLLVVMQRSENTKYQAFRAKWNTRITYASQWVPGDAKKTEKQLYKYDAIHAAVNKELTKQIKANRYLEKKPLTCSSKDEAKLSKKVQEIHGYKGKKAVSGNALIAEYQKQENDFANKDFKKSGDKMISKLHKAKQKHSKPQYKSITVKQV